MSVPVLMYHHILPNSSFIAFSVNEFREQMSFLAQNGWTTLSSDEFYRYKKGEFQAPKKSLLLTFDDGWRDNYVYAYPILKEFGLKATLFLITEWIEKSSEGKESFEPMEHKEAKQEVSRNPSKVILSWNEIEKMKDVFDFHSHTHTHRDNYFEKLTWNEEFEKSRTIIQQRLGFDDLHLCWPRGVYDNTSIKKAKEEGFELFYTIQRGVNKPDGNMDEIKRIAAKKGIPWLKKTLFIFSNNFLGTLYSRIKND